MSKISFTPHTFITCHDLFGIVDRYSKKKVKEQSLYFFDGYHKLVEGLFHSYNVKPFSYTHEFYLRFYSSVTYNFGNLSLYFDLLSKFCLVNSLTASLELSFFPIVLMIRSHSKCERVKNRFFISVTD